MTHLQTLFGSLDINQPRDHEGKFSPIKKSDPQEQVKQHFLTGATLTVQQCLRLYRTTELRRIVSRLRKQGMNIGGEMYKGEYKIYKLVKEEKDGN